MRPGPNSQRGPRRHRRPGMGGPAMLMSPPGLERTARRTAVPARWVPVDSAKEESAPPRGTPAERLTDPDDACAGVEDEEAVRLFVANLEARKCLLPQPTRLIGRTRAPTREHPRSEPASGRIVPETWRTRCRAGPRPALFSEIDPVDYLGMPGTSVPRPALVMAPRTFRGG